MKIRLLVSHLFFVALLALPWATHGAASFEERWKAAEHAVVVKRSEGVDAFNAEMEKQARELIKDFPDKSDAYDLLNTVAENSVKTKALTIYKELSADSVPPAIRDKAKAAAAKLDSLGKPLELKFTAVDGRAVDLARLKGKVVLVDFWATWCPPCVAEMPGVVATYAKFHDRGFEIVGIDLDEEKPLFLDFIHDKKMTWPQYFDGMSWQSPLTQRLNVTQLPTMLLIDKHGLLRDQEATDNLVEKVEKLLAE